MMAKIFNARKFILYTLVVFGALCFPQHALTFPNATLSNQVDMDFGEIEYLGTGSVSMGTNGNLTYSGNFSGAGMGTAGAVLASLTNSTLATVSCSASATLTNAVGDAITLSNVEFVIGAGNRTTFGSGFPCGGIGVSVGNFTFSGATNNRTIFLGGRLNITGPLTGAGTYSSANAGGESITVIVTAI